MVIAVILFLLFILIELVNPLAGVKMLACIFVGGIFSWIMWALRDKQMAVVSLMCTGLVVLYFLLDVAQSISIDNIITSVSKRFIGG